MILTSSRTERRVDVGARPLGERCLTSSLDSPSCAGHHRPLRRSSAPESGKTSLKGDDSARTRRPARRAPSPPSLGPSSASSELLRGGRGAGCTSPSEASRTASPPPLKRAAEACTPRRATRTSAVVLSASRSASGARNVGRARCTRIASAPATTAAQARGLRAGLVPRAAGDAPDATARSRRWRTRRAARNNFAEVVAIAAARTRWQSPATGGGAASPRRRSGGIDIRKRAARASARRRSA